MNDFDTRNALSAFLKYMGFKPKLSIRAVTEYGLYCRVPTWTLFNANKLDKWENQTLPKIEGLLLSANGPTLVAIYKARRYSLKGRILIQPRKAIMFLFVTVVWVLASIADLKDSIATFMWKAGL